MKIAIFTDVFLGATGGIISSIKAQREGLEELGHQVTIFCPGSPELLKELPPEERKGVEIVPTCRVLKPGGAPLARNPRVILRWLKEKYPDFDFDIVHTQYEAGCSIAGMLMGRERGVPVVQTMHGREDMAVTYNIPHPFKAFVADQLDWYHSWYIPHTVVVKRDNKWARTRAQAKMWTMMVDHANFADFVITPSHHFGAKLRHYGVKRPMGVSSNAISGELLETKAKVRKYDGGELKMIWNSRLSREKRVMEFLECLEQLTVPYRLLMYGDGNEEERARRFVRERGLMVEFMGVAKREEILKKMEGCHLGILASFGFDNQPMTLLEAEATGLPVFICDPDMREVVPEGGYVLAKGPEPKEMAAAIEEVAREPKRIEEMSRVMVEHRKDAAEGNQIKELEKIYRQLRTPRRG